MDITKEMLKQTSQSQRNQYLFPEVMEASNKIFKEFNYLNLSLAKKKELVQMEIEKSVVTFNDECSYEKFITSAIYESLDKLVRTTLAKYQNRKKLIIDFINKKLSMPVNYDTALTSLKVLERFFNNYHFSLSEDLAFRLGIESNILSTILDYITEKDLEIIKSNKLFDKYLDENMVTLIKIYYKEKYLESKISFEINEEDLVLPETKLLSMEEEKIFFIKIRNGDEQAKEIFIKKNQGLVLKIAKMYLNKKQDLEIEDLIQEGNIGLLKAITKFDPSMNNKFSTYAINWIRQSISRYIIDKTKDIRIPTGLYERYLAVKNRLSKNLERKITPEDIAKELRVDCETVLKIIPSCEPSVEDIVIDGNDNNNLNVELNNLFIKMNLKEKEVQVLKLRFGFVDGIPHTLNECGIALNLTRERVRQIEVKALEKLRNLSKADMQKFTTYLDDPAKAYERIEEYQSQYNQHTFYDRFTSYQHEEIDMIINEKLSSLERTIIYKRYSNGLDKNAKGPNNYSIYDIIKKIKYYLENPEEKSENQKNFYENFPDYSREELDQLVNDKLTFKQKQLLFKYYVNGLEKPALNIDAVLKRLYSALAKKLQHQDLNLYERFPDYTPEEIDQVINEKITKKQKEAIYTKFANGFDKLPCQSVRNITQAYDAINRYLDTLKQSKKKINEEEYNITNKDNLKMLEFLKTSEFFNLISLLDPKEATVALLRFGFVDNKYYSISEIASFLNISFDEVLLITKKVLLLYKEKLISLFTYLLEDDNLKLVKDVNNGKC